MPPMPDSDASDLSMSAGGTDYTLVQQGSMVTASRGGGSIQAPHLADNFSEDSSMVSGLQVSRPYLVF